MASLRCCVRERLFLRDIEQKREGCTLLLYGCYRECAAVGFHNGFGDREAEPRASMCAAVARCIGTVETIKHIGQIGGGDASTSIADN